MVHNTAATTETSGVVRRADAFGKNGGTGTLSVKRSMPLREVLLYHNGTSTGTDSHSSQMQGDSGKVRKSPFGVDGCCRKQPRCSLAIVHDERWCLEAIYAAFRIHPQFQIKNARIDYEWMWQYSIGSQKIVKCSFSLETMFRYPWGEVLFRHNLWTSCSSDQWWRWQVEYITSS